MKKINLITKCFTICVLCMLSGGSIFAQGFPGMGGGGGNTGLPLVAETDFSSSTKSSKDYFAALVEVDGFGKSVIMPHLQTSISLMTSTKSTATKSDFLSKFQYGVTSNPVRLDSLRFKDNNDNGEWGFVVSGGAMANQKLLSFDVSGLKDGGRYKVEIEYCNPFATGKIPAGYASQIRVGVNNGGTNSQNLSEGNTKIQSGGCATATINGPTTNQETLDIANGRLTVNVYAGQLQSGEAIMIKAIRVYAEVEPAILGLSTVCAGGETALLTADNTYMGCTMQWYRDGVKLNGETGTTYTHVSTKTLNPGETKKYKYTYKVTTPNGDEFTSSAFEVTDKVCCIGDDGQMTSRKMIWQDDFGTFTSAKNYWTWDYSDLAEPKKEQHTNGKDWTACTAVSEHANADCSTAPSMEGQYSVAANVTCAYDNVQGGTQWGWEAYFGNGKHPKENGWTYIPDHTYGTTGEYGGMLFLNCNNEHDKVIYTRTIKGLCQKHLTLTCYVNTFSDSKNPVDIYIQVKDLNSGEVHKSKRVTKSSTGSKDWVAAEVDVDLTGTDLELSIVSYGGDGAGGDAQYNKYGNDLVLDDIQIFACSQPAINIYFNQGMSVEDTVSCEGDDMGLYVNETEMIKTNLGGKAYYVFQYTTTPDDSKSWKTIAGPVTDLKVEDLSSTFDPAWKPGKQVYYRCVLGEREALEAEISNYGYFRPNAPCGEFSVSTPISITKDCPQCYESAKPIISADGKKVKSVHLCEGESVTLTSNDVTSKDKDGNPYANYTLSWHKNDTKTTKISVSDQNPTAKPLEVKWDDADKDGTLYILKVQDNFLDQNGKKTENCNTYDTITIYADTVPVAPALKIPAFCEGLASDNDDVNKYINDLISLLSGYTETIEDASAANSWNFSKFIDVLDGLKADDSPVTFSLTLTDKTTKCVSRPVPFSVTINEIPSEPETHDKDYVLDEGVKKSLSETAKVTDASYSLEWQQTSENGSENPSQYTSTVPEIPLDEEAVFYYFVRQVSSVGCEGPGKKVKVTVNTSPLPLKIDTMVCLNSPVDIKDLVSTTDAIYELHWYDSKVTPDGSGSLVEPSVPTDKPGVYEFYVTQQSTVSPFPESKLQTVTVEVVGVYEPDTTGNTYHYCSDDAPVELVAKVKKDESKSYYADEVVWSVNGGSESATKPTVDTHVNTTTTYEYKAYQTYTIKNSKKDVCKGDALTWDVEVTFVPALSTSQVTYMKADAENGTFAKNLMEQSENDAVTDYASTMKLWWYEDDCTTKVGDGKTAPTPKVDPSVAAGVDQELSYCVRQEVSGCLSEGTEVPVLISDAPKPNPTDYVYCKGDAAEKLTTKPDMTIKPNATYVLKWYGNGERGDYTDLHLSGDEGPTPTTNMRGGEIGKSEYYYYVTQTEIVNGQEGAESNRTEIKVTVYDQTEIAIDKGVLGAVCKPATVDIAKSVSFTNEVANLTYDTRYYTDNTLAEELTGTKVGVSGDYYVQTSFEVKSKSNKATCVSDPTPIPVTVDTLQVLVEDVGTCPNMEAKFTVQANTNTTGVKYTWNAADGNDPNGGTTTNAEFTTRKFTGADYGDVFEYLLKVEAGTCTYDDKLKVTLGEGPVTGTMTITEDGNSYEPNTFTDTKFNEFYSCGASLKIKADYHEADGTAITDYKWYDGTKQIGTGPELELPETANSGDRTYRVDFTNGCPTNVTITIHYRPIKATPLSTKVTKLCEGEEFSAEVKTDFADGESPVYTWYRNGAEVEMGGGTSLDVSRTKLTIDKVKTKDSGRYTFLMTNRGCVARAELDSLVAMPYIVATEKIDTIVARYSNPNIELDVTVPAGGADVKYDWRGTRGESESTNPLSLSNVTSDHYYEVTLSAEDHCDATAVVDVKVDAKLVLKTTLKDTICTGLSAVLTIDTTGTGKFRHEDWSRSLTVTATSEGVTTDLTGSVTRDGDLLKLTVSPTTTATYKINFNYGPQDTTATELLYVIPAIGVTIPEAVTICQGEATDIVITDIQPEGTVIKWNADTTILTESLDTAAVTVKPVYLGGTNHQYQYAYDFVAYNTFCNSSVPYTAYVKVDEPLEGEILGDHVICETFSSRLDASSYAATTYVWTVEGDTVNQGASMTVTPAKTTHYFLSMDRGVCHKDDDFLLTVKTNPVIVDMDSVDIRNREVILKDGAGEEPFNFWVDDLVDSRTIDPVLYNLKFSKHTAHVSDKNGCVGEFLFEVPAPGIYIPPYFTPNSDGINDNWIVAELPIVYPNAVVKIYDRFGKLLAEYLGSKEDGWDGTYKGQPMPSTDYWYVIDVEEIDRQFLGHFTLLRQ